MSSSAAESPDEMADGQYSLRWNNHQSHIMHAFETLLHAEVLVDVTLVCAETSLRAHKIVLSICSPFFARIFAEHPCKHPVIVLKDFPGREIAALIDFMYRGEVRVDREDLGSLMHAAESLQIRGLAASVPRPASPPETPMTDMLLADDESARQLLMDGTLPDEEDDIQMDTSNHAPSPTSVTQDQSLPHMGHLNFNLRDLSPLMPRRKQARPRRRSGEIMPQDLSKQNQPQQQSNSDESSSAVVNLSNKEQQQQQSQQQSQQNQHQQIEQQLQQQSQQQQQLLRQSPLRRSPLNHLSQQQPQSQHHGQQQEECEDVAENLSMKRELKNAHSPSTSADHMVKSESEAASSPRASPLVASGLHSDTTFVDPTAGLAAMSSLTLTPPHHHGSEYLTSLGQLAAQWLPDNHQNHLSSAVARLSREGSPLLKPPGFHYPQSEAPLPPRNFAMEGMQLPPGLFPPGAPLELHEGFKPENLHSLYMNAASLGHQHAGKKTKKHRGDGAARRWSDHTRSLATCRPKGQHSAPRGGPPRSWTNADLTEALTMVWHKKMTTSQASRVFGIPYNSLLMYVRGKYGKSLKLEQLRKDCIGELINNNNVKAIEPPPQPTRLPSLAPPPHPSQAEAEAANFAHHQLLSQGLAQAGFFPEFGFPVPVNMVHLLPPSEQQQSQGNSSGASNGHPQQQQQLPQSGRVPDDGAIPSTSRTPSPTSTNTAEGMMPPSAQSAPAQLQQNGSE